MKIDLDPVCIQESAQKPLKDLEDAGVVEPCTVPVDFMARGHFVMKPNGGARMVTDYKPALNPCVRRMHRGFQTVNDIRQSIPASAKVFISLDMKEGYFQARIRKEDRPKTAFMINAGSGARRLQYIRCPQGLSSSSDHFNTATDKIFESCQSFMMKIIDNILIFADSYAQLEERLRKVLSQARDNKIIFSKTKYRWERKPPLQE